MCEINKLVYPKLSEYLDSVKESGVPRNTSYKNISKQYRKIALNTRKSDGSFFNIGDLPKEVKSSKMKHFHALSDYVRRACTDKKSNRLQSREDDRVTRYLRFMISSTARL